MYGLLLAVVYAVSLGDVGLAWPTTTIIEPASTRVVTGYTDIESDATYSYALSTVTQKATTYERPDTTITEAAETIVQYVIPTALADLPPDLLNALIYFAPDVTSIPTAVVSQLLSDIRTYHIEYTATNTAPPILTQARDDLESARRTSSWSDDFYKSVLEDIFPFQPSSIISELQGLVSPYPTLSSELMAYISAEATYEAPLVLGEGSIISQDLSLTAVPPSYLSALSDYVPTVTGAATTGTSFASSESVGSSSFSSASSSTASTSSSAGAAAPTGEIRLAISVVVVAAGAVGMALL